MVSQIDPHRTSPPFQQAALAALGHYAIQHPQMFFLQHNSGVTFRLDCAANEQYLLKLHLPINGEAPTPNPIISSRMQWLADLYSKTGILVQVPVKNLQNRWVTPIFDQSRTEPIPCTVQAWVKGTPPYGDFTHEQLIRLGQLMAQFHGYSSQFTGFQTTLPSTSPAQLAGNIEELHRAVDFGLLSEEEFAPIRPAGSGILALMKVLRNDPRYWGPIHGDIHQDNVLIDQNDVRVIDFDGLFCGPYIYDLGVTLYHIWYQGVNARQAFLSGYQQKHRLPGLPTDWIKTCVAWAAIDNLAWQITIPQQREGELLKKNLKQLVQEFCRI